MFKHVCGLTEKTSRVPSLLMSLGLAAGLPLVLFGGTIRYSPSRTAVSEQRPITVRDAIEMTVPGDPDYWSATWSKQSVAKVSPDGSRFIVVLKRGDVESNTNRYSMLLWMVSDISRGAALPRTVLEMSSSSNLGAMSHIEWSSDNETVWFLGENPGEKQQVYEVNTRTGAVKCVTHHPTNVLGFSPDSTGNRVAYLAERPAEDLWNDETRRSGIVVSNQENLKLADLILGRKGSGALVDRRETVGLDLFLEDSSGEKSLRLSRGLPDALTGTLGGNVSLSPNGVYVVALTGVPVKEVPSAWHEYDDSLLTSVLGYEAERIRKGFGGNEWTQIMSYEILDTRSGRGYIPLNAPVSLSYGLGKLPVWAPNSGSVVLSGVFLPLDVANPVERKARTLQPTTVEIDPASRAFVPIGDRCHQAVSWDATTDELTCIAEADERGESWKRYEKIVQKQQTGKAAGPEGIFQPMDQPIPLVRYRKSGGQWHEVNGEVAQHKDIEVVLREDMNTPPKIYVRQTGQKDESLLLDLNPQFKDLRFGKVEELSWEWAKGQSTNGGLYYPLDYRPGRRYPLVIQTHGWTPYRFGIEGFSSTGYAAQALAARGMFVLQMNDMYIPMAYTGDAALKEMQNTMAIYRAAVDHLKKRGLIDAQSVGITGWSHTCDSVLWALTHVPSLFKAAAVSGEDTGGYLMFMSRWSGGSVDSDSLYGGPPFGQHLRTWIELSPTFNLDRIQAPLRLNVLSAPLYLLMEWECFEGLNLLHKPVEMVMLESADHILIKPAERMVVSGGNVDWFDFWLNGHEDSDPAKADQYARWRELRKSQE